MQNVLVLRCYKYKELCILLYDDKLSSRRPACNWSCLSV